MEHKNVMYTVGFYDYDEHSVFGIIESEDEAILIEHWMQERRGDGFAFEGRYSYHEPVVVYKNLEEFIKDHS